ncbi:hypothetical protein KASHIRA_01830 [Serratia phage vB_SmaM-Kashira]|nr:hypothetical protein [Acinetobacter phage ABPH49]URC22757.1 hypothetical protein KASHIRA_01830 [Serratia phage vB_SmaM-Kashira]
MSMPQSVAVVVPRKEYELMSTMDLRQARESGYLMYSDALPGGPGAVDWNMMSFHFSAMMIHPDVEIVDEQLERLLTRMMPSSYPEGYWSFRADNDNHLVQVARCLTTRFIGERDVAYHRVERIIKVAEMYGPVVVRLVRDFFEKEVTVAWPAMRVCGKIDDAIVTATSNGNASTISLRRDDNKNQEVSIMGVKNIIKLRDLLNQLIEEINE